MKQKCKIKKSACGSRVWGDVCVQKKPCPFKILVDTKQ